MIQALTGFLEKHGFPVERKYIVDTGFKAEWGEGKPCVSVLCEYDALPEIGHACGHNLIAEVGAGAGLGIKAALQAASKEGKSLGKVTMCGLARKVEYKS
jgi:metal-dependent amidase/aminoacylase/carboxypeptidase family protein